MQIMRIDYSSRAAAQNQNFKSAIPVFVMLKDGTKNAAPIIGEEINETFMRKTEYLLNNSLKKADKEKDALITRFRKYFGRWVQDFNPTRIARDDNGIVKPSAFVEDKVLAFTCVDGEMDDGLLKPYFYFLTGKTKEIINKLRAEHKDAVKQSQGYDTGNLKIAKDNYYNIGKNAVLKEFGKFHPFGRTPHAMYVYYEPIRKKNGEIKDYRLFDVKFLPVENPKNPSVKLDKRT